MFEKFRNTQINEEALVKSSLDSVSAYIRSKKGSPLSIGDCVSYALEAFKLNYRLARGRKPHDALKPQELQEMTTLYNKHEDDLRKGAMERLMSYTKTLKSKEIRSVTTEILVSSALREAGFKFNIIPQCYRAKVNILLETGMAITVFVKYKEAETGKIDGIMASVVALANQITSMKRDVQVWNAKNSINWTGWQK